MFQNNHDEKDVEIIEPYELKTILEDNSSNIMETSKREHKLLLPMIIFLLIVGIGGYFLLNSFGVFGTSKILCTRQDTDSIPIYDQYQFSFENNLLSSFTYENNTQLPTSSKGTDRYRFESYKAMLAFQSNKMKAQSGVTVSSEMTDMSYHLIVKVHLKQVNNEMVSMLENEEEMLELDMSKQDVLRVMTENKYQCDIK